MEIQKKDIYIMNHWIKEILNHNINPNISKNPRYESILWFLSLKVKKLGLPIEEKATKEWLEKYLILDKQGNLSYLIPIEEGYEYRPGDEVVFQVVTYDTKQESDVLNRRVRSYTRDWQEQYRIESQYNQDGIEMKQILKESWSSYLVVKERIQNRPELIRESQYGMTEEGWVPKLENYLVRHYFEALEDFSPSFSEVDPLDQHKLFEVELPEMYNLIGQCNWSEYGILEEEVLPLTEEVRQKLLQRYCEKNKELQRTTVYEKGFEKLFIVKKKER